MSAIKNKKVCWLHCCERHTEKILQNILSIHDSQETVELIQEVLSPHKINFKLKPSKEKDPESKISDVDMIPFSQCQIFWEKKLGYQVVEKICEKRM